MTCPSSKRTTGALLHRVVPRVCDSTRGVGHSVHHGGVQEALRFPVLVPGNVTEHFVLQPLKQRGCIETRVERGLVGFPTVAGPHDLAVRMWKPEAVHAVPRAKGPALSRHSHSVPRHRGWACACSTPAWPRGSAIAETHYHVATSSLPTWAVHVISHVPTVLASPCNSSSVRIRGSRCRSSVECLRSTLAERPTGPIASAVSNAVLPPPFSAKKHRRIRLKWERQCVEAAVVLEAHLPELKADSLEPSSVVSRGDT